MSSGVFGDANAIPREDQGPVLGPGWWHGAMVTVFITGIVLAGFLLLGKSAETVEERRQIALAIFAICTIPFALTMTQLFRLRSKIGKAELFLPHDSLPLGFSGAATYLRPLRGGAAIREIEARLQCVETLVKGSGKNQRTFRAIVYDQPATVVTTPMMEQMRVQVSFRVPESGPPTLSSLSRVTIQWMIRLRLKMDGCPNTRSSFEVTVIPVMVKR